jgi:hypothetical protein
MNGLRVGRFLFGAPTVASGLQMTTAHMRRSIGRPAHEGTLMLPKIIRRALLIGGVIIGVASSYAYSEGIKKHDIQGFEVGMSRDDIVKKLEPLHCTDPRGIVISAASYLPYVGDIDAKCANGTNFKFICSPYLETHPLLGIQTTINTQLPMQELIASIEQQFDVQLRQASGVEYRADLGANRMLLLQYMTLSIIDDKLVQESNSAQAEFIRRTNPAPKF